MWLIEVPLIRLLDLRRRLSAIFELVIGFLLAAIALTLMPGPDILYVMTESIATGRRAGMAIATGLVTGLIWHITLTATGVGFIIKENPMLYQMITYAGVVYLLYLAYGAYMDRPTPPLSDPKASKTASTDSVKVLFLRGITMNILNPKVTIFFLALLPGFVNSESLHPIKDILVLGLIFMVQAIIIFYIVVYLADKLRQMIDSEGFWRWLYWIRIGVLLGIAVLLLLH